MKTNIFIPKQINVGFQNRNDTYTKKLAYVIYFDQKGVLRKEKSWESWRDKKIDNIIHDNVPTSGFVLNKKVGDYKSDWNHRQAYVRVYDPRDFEFEITIENLLYILENTSSIIGKGLEGEFVYGWDDKNLVLIPCNSPDYKEINAFNEIIHQKNYVKAKDLILGATYKTKTNEEWIYMGRFDYYDYVSEKVPYETTNYYGQKIMSSKYISKNVNKGKHHFFIRECKNTWSEDVVIRTLILKSLGERFISTVSTDCVENYAELFEKLECDKNYSPYDESKDEYIRYTLEEIKYKLEHHTWFYCFGVDKRVYNIIYNRNMYLYDFYEKDNYSRSQRKGCATIEEIYNTIQPMYKNEYLANNKFYRRIN